MRDVKSNSEHKMYFSATHIINKRSFRHIVYKHLITLFLQKHKFMFLDVFKIIIARKLLLAKVHEGLSLQSSQCPEGKVSFGMISFLLGQGRGC